MKKKIFGGIAVLAFAAIVGLNVKMNADKNQISDLALANVEALASESPVTVITCSKPSNGQGMCHKALGNGAPQKDDFGITVAILYTCEWTGKTVDSCKTWVSMEPVI